MVKKVVKKQSVKKVPVVDFAAENLLEICSLPELMAIADKHSVEYNADVDTPHDLAKRVAQKIHGKTVHQKGTMNLGVINTQFAKPLQLTSLQEKERLELEYKNLLKDSRALKNELESIKSELDSVFPNAFKDSIEVRCHAIRNMIANKVLDASKSYRVDITQDTRKDAIITSLAEYGEDLANHYYTALAKCIDTCAFEANEPPYKPVPPLPPGQPVVSATPKSTQLPIYGRAPAEIAGQLLPSADGCKAIVKNDYTYCGTGTENYTNKLLENPVEIIKTQINPKLCLTKEIRPPFRG